MTTTLSSYATDQLLTDPLVQIRGFFASFKRVMEEVIPDDHSFADFMEYECGYKGRFPYIPDAHKVWLDRETECWHLRIFEVEVKCPVSEDKAAGYMKLADAAEVYGVSIDLALVNKVGHAVVWEPGAYWAALLVHRQYRRAD